MVIGASSLKSCANHSRWLFWLFLLYFSSFAANFTPLLCAIAWQFTTVLFCSNLARIEMMLNNDAKEDNDKICSGDLGKAVNHVYSVSKLKEKGCVKCFLAGWKELIRKRHLTKKHHLPLVQVLQSKGRKRGRRSCIELFMHVLGFIEMFISGFGGWKLALLSLTMNLREALTQWLRCAAVSSLHGPVVMVNNCRKMGQTQSNPLWEHPVDSADKSTLTGDAVAGTLGLHSQALLWTRLEEKFPLKHNRLILRGLGLWRSWWLQEKGHFCSPHVLMNRSAEALPTLHHSLVAGKAVPGLCFTMHDTPPFSSGAQWSSPDLPAHKLFPPKRSSSYAMKSLLYWVLLLV